MLKEGNLLCNIFCCEKLRKAFMNLMILSKILTFVFSNNVIISLKIHFGETFIVLKLNLVFLFLLCYFRRNFSFSILKIATMSLEIMLITVYQKWNYFILFCSVFVTTFLLSEHLLMTSLSRKHLKEAELKQFRPGPCYK